MYKSIIYKYFFSEVTKSFLIVLFTFTAIAWTVRAVNFLDLVIENLSLYNCVAVGGYLFQKAKK